MKKLLKNTAFCYFLFFILFFAAMLLVPHSIDDTYYDYLNLTGIRNIFSFAAGYGNGRILGNALAVILCKSAVIAAAVRSAAVTLLSYFLYKITNGIFYVKGNKLPLSLFLMISLLLVSPVMFGQDYAWISAFSNYVPPVLAISLLIYIYICTPASRPKKCKILLYCILTAVLAFSAQLYSENTSVFNIILPAALLVLSFFGDREKKKGARLQLVFWFVFALLGFGLMMYARMYLKDPSNSYSSYADFHIHSLKDIAMTAASNSFNITADICENHFIFIALSALSVYILNSKEYSNIKSSKQKIIMSAVLIAFPVYIIVDSIAFGDRGAENFASARMAYANYFIMELLLLAYIISVIASAAHIEDKTVKKAFIFSFAFAIFTALSMVLLTPVNARCFFITYVFMVISCGVLLNYCVKPDFLNSKIPLSAMVSSLGLIFVFLITFYANSAAVARQIDEYAEYQIEENHISTLVLPEFNSQCYFHTGYADKTYCFKYYKNEPKDIVIKSVSLNEWEREYYKYGDYKEE